MHPNGTIVVLKQGSKKIMIFGRKQIREIDNLVYDYVGCLYPEGFLSSKLNVFFNERDVSEIIHKGFQDIEETEYLAKLRKYPNSRSF